MVTTVDTLLVRIEADMSDLKRSLDKVQRDVDKSSQGIAGAFKRIGTAMKAAVAAVIVQQGARAGMALVNLASDVEEMQGKSKVVFGAFRDQTVAALEAFGNEVGRSTHELELMASSIQDTFVPMGFARGEAAKLSVDLTKLAVDVASFNNANDTETMEAFQSALVGNHETVRRFGVVITEATLKQELLRMGITATGDAVSNSQKVQARLNLILAGTTDAQGDAARTADSFANQMKALKAELSEVGVELGTILLPFAKDLVTTFRSLTDATRKFLAQLGLIDLTPADRIGMFNRQLEKTEDLLNNLSDAEGNSDFLQNIARNAGFDINNFRGSTEDLFNALQADLNARAEDLRLQIDLQKLLQERPDAGGAGADAGGGGSEPFKASKQQQKIAGQNAVMAKRIQMQADINQLTKSGNLLVAEHVKKELELFDANVKLAGEADRLGTIEVQRLIALGHTDNLTQKLVIDNIELTASQTALTNSVKLSAEALKEYQELVQEGVDFVRANIDNNYEFEKSQTALNAALAAGAVNEEDYRAAMALLALEQARTLPLFSDFENGMLNMADNISGALADMSQGAKLTFRDFQKMFDAFVRDMIAQAIKLLIVNAILRAMGVPLRYDGSGFKAGKGTAFGGAIQESATGGAMSRGRPYLVGERGPELIIPASSGTIKNAHDTRNAMKGGATVVNQTINVETGVSQTVRAEMLSLLPVIKQDTLAAVADGKRRGGSFGQVLS
jgi:hypothetical protein